MKWNTITSEEQVPLLQSQPGYTLIFKHSTRCPVSLTALKRIESAWQINDEQHIRPYLVNVLKERPISNKVASHYGVEHASPQVLLIGSSGCVYSAEQEGVNYADLKAAVAEPSQ